MIIHDEIEEPNKDEAINQLEILARRGISLFLRSVTHDKNGNPVWKAVCRIPKYDRNFIAESSSKKDDAFVMLKVVLK